jgi:hypothetical protein
MEKNILNGIEYILNVINNISNLIEFQNSKPEILKALNDIKNTTINLINEKQKKNFNQDLQNNYTNPYCENLELKFNYIPYLNNDLINNNISNLIYNDDNINQNYHFQNINCYNNPKYKIENNFNTINSNVSLKNDIEHNLHNNNIYKNYILNKDLKYNELKEKKLTLSKVTDLVMKINNDNGIYEILIKLFGEDLIDKIILNNNDKFINEVKEAMNKIEDLRKKDEEIKINEKNNINKKNNKISSYNKLLNKINNKISPSNKLLIINNKDLSFSNKLLINNKSINDKNIISNKNNYKKNRRKN